MPHLPHLTPGPVTHTQVLKFQMEAPVYKPNSYNHILVARLWACWRGSTFHFHRQLGHGTLPKLNTVGIPKEESPQRSITVNTVWRQCFRAFFRAYTLGVSVQKMILYFSVQFFVLRKEYSKVKFTQKFPLNSITPWCLKYITLAICDCGKKKSRSYIRSLTNYQLPKLLILF